MARSDAHSLDDLYAAPLGDIAGFSFNEEVAAVFPDMLKRSIPGYQAIIAQTGILGGRYVQPNTHCYDLGCSLGATTLALRKHVPGTAQLVAVDNSVAMIDRFRLLLADSSDNDLCPIELRCENIEDTPVTNASMVTLNFTLQFVEPDHRLTLLQRLYDSMNEGAALILSEKMRLEDEEFDALFTERYYAFKRAMGYSELEISQKRTALENVLIPDSLDGHRDRLHSVGFKRNTVWYQCFNFFSLIAIK